MVVFHLKDVRSKKYNISDSTMIWTFITILRCYVRCTEFGLSWLNFFTYTLQRFHVLHQYTACRYIIRIVPHITRSSEWKSKKTSIKWSICYDPGTKISSHLEKKTYEKVNKLQLTLKTYRHELNEGLVQFV